MGIFSSISEGMFAAKVVNLIAKNFHVHSSKLPEWVLSGAKESAHMYKSNGYSPEDAALSILESQGNQIVEDMMSKS